MKKIIPIFLITISSVILTSCEEMFGDFLQKAPGVDVTVDTLFSSASQVETFLSGIYEQGVLDEYGIMQWQIGSATSNNGYNYNAATNGASCDEAEATQGWITSNSLFNTALFNVGSTGSWDIRYNVRWYVIRQVNTMLANIDKAPLDPAYIEQIKGEVKVIRAFCYFEAWRNYGGQPLVTKAFSVNENLKVPQSSVDSTVNFIVQDCNDAIPVLPDFYPSNLTGRITKGAALALKAKVLLYAASPQWNTGTPVLSMANPADNRLICYENYDVNRWKLAADAAKAVLDWAPAGNIQLVTNQGVDKNYKYTWEVNDNSEVILANQSVTTVGTKNNTDKNQYPVGFYGYPYISWGWTGILITQTFIEKFYDKTDGNPQTWAASGNDLNQKYAELDPRFKQSISYNGNYFNSITGIMETFTGGKHVSQCRTGYWLKKPIPENWRTAAGYPKDWKWPVFRLADAYLWYAEALNEYNSSPPPEAYTAINTIRARSGMPNLPAGLTQAQFRERVQKERAVEFFMENSRLWDIRRWLIADQDGVMKGPFYGLKIDKFGTGTPQQFSYQRIPLETRYWENRMYLFPHNPTEVNKGVFKQNPGW